METRQRQGPGWEERRLMKAREARRRAGLPTLLSLSRTRSRRAYVGGHGGHRRLSQGSSGGRAGDTERSWGDSATGPTGATAARRDGGGSSSASTALCRIGGWCPPQVVVVGLWVSPPPTTHHRSGTKPAMPAWVDWLDWLAWSLARAAWTDGRPAMPSSPGDGSKGDHVDDMGLRTGWPGAT